MFRTMTRIALAGIAAVALTACGGEADEATTENAALAADDIGILPPDESVATPTEDLADGVVEVPPEQNYISPNPDTAIPAVFHGRWGLTAEACASERDDTPGLVTIAADRINFHNSIAVPQKTDNATPNRIQGEFAFASGGRTWTGPMSWTVEGRRLIRVDSEPDSRLVYTRC